MGATRGNNYNGTGVLSWCVSQSWHPGYQLPDGTRDPYNSALDEVAQVKAAPPGQPGSWSDPVFYDSCHSDPADPTGKVDLTTYGSTDSSSCSSPCVSLVVIANSKSYRDGCDYIEAALWDAWDPVHKEGNRRGTQIIMHAQAPNNSGAPYSLPSIQVTTTGLYASNEIGTITNDTDCQGGFRGYHVHHAFVPPVTQSCSWAENTPGGFVFQATDRKKGPQNTADWVHMLSHQPGIFCDDVGPKSADNLLDPATGALDGDGNGAGTRALATGGPGYTITTSQTCFPGVRTGVRGNRCTGHIGNRLLAIPKINLVDTLMAEQDVKNSVDLRGLESDWIAGEGAADPELPPVHVRHAALLHLAHQQLRRVLDGRHLLGKGTQTRLIVHGRRG